jgi:hypothetical protein
MSDEQDMAEDLDDDVIANDPVTTDELVDRGGDELDGDLSEALIADSHGLVGDDHDLTPEEAALHLVDPDTAR